MRKVLISVLVAAMLAVGGRTQGASPKRPPNIVMFVIDELGYYELSCMGHPVMRTPNVDRLAAEGLRFTQALAGGCVCAPTRCTLMTGLHTGHASVRDNPGGTPLRADDVTVAQVLKQAGYACGGFGKWGLGDRGTTGVPEQHGFDLFFGYYHQVHAHTFFPKYLLRNSALVELEGNHDDYHEGKTFSQYLIFQQTKEFIRANKDRPFFAYVPWTPPHGRWGFPRTDPSWQLYKDRPWTGGERSWPGPSSPDDPKVYAAMVNLVDRQVGEVMTLVKDLGLEDNTIVFFSGDNGGHTYFADAEHPAGLFGPNVDPKTGKRFRGGKGNLYEGGLRIPMIVRWPGRVAPGAVSDLSWYFPDVMPTLAELAGARPPEGIDGVSIVPTLLGEKAAGHTQQQHEYLYWEWERSMAVRAGSWKAVKPGPKAGWELYDLARDVEEKSNLAAEHPDVVAKLAGFARQAHTPVRPGGWVDKSKGFRPAPGVTSYQP